MKKFFVSALVSVSLLTAGVSANAATSFVDIEQSYAKDAITDLQAKGIIDGMDSSHFVPEGTVSRAQFVTIMVRTLGLEAKATSSSFKDVTDWAIPYAEAAFKAGIIEGVADGVFDPNASITREAAATILVRTLSTKGKLDQTDAVNFTDSAKISAWAKPFIAVAQKYALISGFPDGSFDPQGIANRAMSATMGKNLLAAIAKVVAVVPTTPVPTTPEITPTTPVAVGGGGGGHHRRSTTPTPTPQQEVPVIVGGKATFSNGTTVEGLPAGASISASIATVAAVPGIETAGQAMDFTFTGTMPAEGLTLSLPTTSDNAGLSYYNTARGKWELQDGSSVVAVGSTKFVKATVHHFSIYGPIIKSAQLVADSITTVSAPTKDATSLTLPKVADGFTVAINSSSKTDVIALDGTIVPPAAETTVSLVLEVTRTSDSTKAVTIAFAVVVPAKTVTEEPNPEPNPGPKPEPEAVVEFQIKPSFVGAFTSDFKVKVNNEYVTNYSLYYDGKLVSATTNGVVTSINNIFNDVSKIKITDTVDRIDSDVTMGTWQ